MINVHHYEELSRDPDKHLPRLLALWKQVAQRYRNQPERVFFEVLNEPQGELTDERWQRMAPQLLGVIRSAPVMFDYIVLHPVPNPTFPDDLERGYTARVAREILPAVRSALDAQLTSDRRDVTR